MESAYTELGRFEEALASLERAREFDGWILMIKMAEAKVYVHMGKMEDARKLISEVEEASKTEYFPQSILAAAYGFLGENDKAFAYLEKAYLERETRFFLSIKVIPWFDPLRSDPRFNDMLKKIRLAD